MALTTIQGGFLGADLVSAQTALTSGLATTDEIIVSDAGVIKRMDISVIEIAASQITASGTLPALNGAALTALNGSNIASGTVAVARLGSGSPGSGNFLRGDGSWQTAGANQTPWTGNIDAANYTLSNVSNAGSDWTNGTLTIARGTSGAVRSNLDTYSAGTDGGAIQFRHSRHATIGSHTALASGDDLGKIRFMGSGGSAFSIGAVIQAKATETFSTGSSNYGTKLEFYTTDNTTDVNDLRMTMEHNGDVTIATGNVVIGTAGKGIDFATNTQSAVTGTGLDSELLDWYEEGTWTPILRDTVSSHAATLSTAVGRYTRIGRLVHIQYKITVSGAGNISNQALTIYLHGLPFTAQNAVTSLQSSFAVGVTALLAVTAGVSVAGVIEQNGTYITILVNDGTTGMSNMQFNELTTSGHLSMAGSYTV